MHLANSFIGIISNPCFTVFMIESPLLAAESFFLRSVPFRVDVTDSVKLDSVLGSLMTDAESWFG